MSGGTFDPWSEWLGIAPDQQPADHYRLLGLAAFESDAAAIERAADERMAIVRKHQTGPRGAITQQVLNRLAAAKQCLLDPATRGAYDAVLRGQMAAQASAAAKAKKRTPTQAPPAFDFTAPPMNAAIDVGMDADGTSSRSVSRRGETAVAPRRAVRPIVVLSVGLSIVTAAVGAWVILNRGESKPTKAPVVIVKEAPRPSTSAAKDAPPIVRPDGGVLHCTAAQVAAGDVQRRDGELVDMTVSEGRVEVSWTVRVFKPGFHAPRVVYSAVGEGAQSFEFELDEATRRSTPIRATAGAFVTDELKPFAFRKTGDYRVTLRTGGTPDRNRTVKVRELELRPISLPDAEKPGR